MTPFDEFKKRNIGRLVQFVPIVARVHGESHPEFHEVRKLFDVISAKVKASGSEKPDLDNELSQLRETTAHYTVPGDVCESYEAVYKMLAELDEAYQHSK
ncbi:MAG: iron-sulfur cluster repair di-iron protein, ric [Bacillota bacterium]|nr:iron-sulfur cluster repair di-iron protein, ric [Bacillota bacterium]MDW7678562.1 iron-sulfur cluster repair di-iron protein, ric [Bacillota bacterium]